MLITMGISLYTSRIILQSLGVQDFGIYNLTSGIISIFVFLNGSLIDATQRFLTFEIGKGDSGNVREVFSICIFLHFLLGAFVALMAEPVGLWMIHNKLLIPAERLEAAEWIFHFSVVSMFLIFTTVPYNAMIISHERMKAFALLSLFETILRFLVAVVLFQVENYDRLIVYGGLLLLIQLAIRVLYLVYCRRNFKEARVQMHLNAKKMREIGGFATWTIFGNLSYVCVTQGLNILLGMFFLPVVNAARGIAVQVQSSINTFVNNFQFALTPQITKHYAAGNLIEMHALLFRGIRYSFFLLLLPLIPIILECDSILTLWLKTVPQYTVNFTRLILLTTVFSCLSHPLSVGAKATGNIKRFEIYVEAIRVLVIPVSYILLRNGCRPEVVFVSYLAVEFISFLNNIWLTHRLIAFSLHSFLSNCVKPMLRVLCFALVLPSLIYWFAPISNIRFFSIFIVSICWTLFMIWKFGLLDDESGIIKTKLFNIIHNHGLK